MALATLASLEANRIELVAFAKTTPGNGSLFKTLWAAPNIPAAGGYDTTLNGATCSSTTAGALPFINPASGITILSRMELNHISTASGQNYMLCDRLWHNGGFDATSTSAQNITSPTWPARDKEAGTSGKGVYLALEISAVMGAGTPTVTISYTNTAGTAGRSATNIMATVTASATATAVFIGLQGGDLGVKSVESLTLSATWTSGTINLVAYRPIIMIPSATMTVDQEPAVFDALSCGVNKIIDSSCLYFMRRGSALLGDAPNGFIQYAQG